MPLEVLVAVKLEVDSPQPVVPDKFPELLKSTRVTIPQPVLFPFIVETTTTIFPIVLQLDVGIISVIPAAIENAGKYVQLLFALS